MNVMTLNGLLDIFMFKKYSLKKSFYIQQEYHFKMPVRESVAEQRKERREERSLQAAFCSVPCCWPWKFTGRIQKP